MREIRLFCGETFNGYNFGTLSRGPYDLTTTAVRHDRTRCTTDQNAAHLNVGSEHARQSNRVGVDFILFCLVCLWNYFFPF